jgi:hypothetical protein
MVLTDRLAGLEAELLNVHVDFPLFQQLAFPVSSGKSKLPGIKIHDTRMIRLMEVLLHGGPQLAGWRTFQIWQALQATFSLSPRSGWANTMPTASRKTEPPTQTQLHTPRQNRNRLLQGRCRDSKTG